MMKAFLSLFISDNGAEAPGAGAPGARAPGARAPGARATGARATGAGAPGVGAFTATTAWIMTQVFEKNRVLVVNTSTQGFGTHAEQMHLIRENTNEYMKEGREPRFATWEETFYHLFYQRHENLCQAHADNALYAYQKQNCTAFSPDDKDIAYTVVWSESFQHVIVGEIKNNSFEEKYWWTHEDPKPGQKMGIPLTQDRFRELTDEQMAKDNSRWSSLSAHLPVCVHKAVPKLLPPLVQMVASYIPILFWERCPAPVTAVKAAPVAREAAADARTREETRVTDTRAVAAPGAGLARPGAGGLQTQ
ncbi:hypothetical protein BH10PSE19_BH10PSE19_08210 [soil metagenome]